MADSLADICRSCVTVVADVPPVILLATLLATALGLLVLVSSRPSNSNSYSYSYTFS